MNAPLALTSLLLLSALTGRAHEHAHGPAHRGLEFHANQGQWPAQVLYRTRTPGGALFVERSAFTYVLQQGGPQHASDPKTVAAPYREHAYRMRFVGGEAQVHSGNERLPHYVNYFLGNDRSRWASGVPAYGGVVLGDVYPGIALRVDGHSGLKYEWLVAPGADPSAIVLAFEGQDEISVEGGLLRIRTTAGDVIEQRPVAWTEGAGGKVPVPCAYKLDGDHLTYVFPDGYDRTRSLVIDPVVVFSSFSGSTGDNFGFTATYDAAGHLYGGGMVRSTGYPVTVGVVQSAYGGGENDIAISKFTPNGDELVWSTYIGGSGNEVPHSMVVNSNDELFVLGTSNSVNFPTTTGCWDNSFNGGTNPPFAVTSYGFSYTTGCDMVVVHLNNTATGLNGSTFVGGTGNDGLNQVTPLNRNYGDPFRGEIILDAEDRPIVVSSTSSTDLFTSTDAPQATFAGGGTDAYVFRMDPELTSMLWATYYGGTAADAGFGVQVSSIGEIYITGGTTSTDLPTAGTPASASYNGGTDGYIARFAPAGSPLLSTTYVGEVGFDQSYFVQLNTSDEVFVVGQTTGPYTITPGKYNNPNATQFLHKFSGDLSSSLWSTRIGGAGSENVSPSAFLVSNCGQIYFSGWAGTTNGFGAAGLFSSTSGLPVTPDAYQSTTNGSDFYLMLLEAEAVSLGYATFFGGTSAEHVDGGTSRFDKDGIVYQAVCAGCGQLSYPTTPGVWSNTNNSTNCNLGVFKIDFEQAVQVQIEANTNDLTLCLEDPGVFTAVGTANTWIWDLGDGSPVQVGTTVAHQYAAPGVYDVMLVGIDSASCNLADTAFASINVVAPADLQPMFEAAPNGDCDAFVVELFNSSTGSNSFVWSFGDGTGSTQTNPVHAYAAPGVYDITLGVIDPICTDTAFMTVSVPVEVPGIELDLASPVALCDGASALLDAGAGYDSYLWSTGDPSMMISVTEAGSYWVEVVDGFCTGQDTIVVVDQPTHPARPDVAICPGDTALLTTGEPVQSILWSTGSSATTIEVVDEGLYWFDAVDAFGCDWTDTVAVLVLAEATGDPIIPNVFTPNGDDANNEYLIEGVDAAQFSLEIYNRWGMKVFASTNPGKGWNGKLDNAGELLPDGTYYYVLTFKDDCARIPLTTRTGHITLLR
jgi:gliding motility-associated-like protein